MNEEKKRILSLVEEGKLTASEALTLLELLEEEKKHNENKEKEIMNELSTVVILDEEDKKKQENEKKVASAKDMILDFVDNVIKKVKDLDLDFSKSVEVSHSFHDPSASFEDINIETANGSIELISWDQEGTKIECEAKVYRTDQQDEAKKMLIQDTTFDVKDNKLFYLVGQKWMKVNSKIYIPNEQYEKIRIRLFNGAIMVSDLKVDKLKAKTGNGKVFLQKIKANEVDIETANGNIGIEEINTNTLHCETINGAVKSNGTFEKADLETFNGGIFVDKFNEEAKVLKIRSTSGSIHVTVPEHVAAKGEVKANLGGLQVDVQGMKIIDEKKEVIQKHIKFENEQIEGLHIYGESKTGSISVVQVK